MGQILNQAIALTGGSSATTQVLYNLAGVVTGESTFTYNQNANRLSVREIRLQGGQIDMVSDGTPMTNYISMGDSASPYVGFLGWAGAPDGIILGSVRGDCAWSNAFGRILFSTDWGDTIAAAIDDGDIVAFNTIRLKGYTVVTLPAGTQGDMAYVTDALAPAWNAPLVGGGAVVCKAFFNGAAWVAG